MVSISVPLVAVRLRGSMSRASAYSALAPFLHPAAIPGLRISCGRFVIAHISFTHGQPGPPRLTAMRMTWGYIYHDVGPRRSCLDPPPGCSSSQQSSCDSSTPRPRHAFLNVTASQEHDLDLLATRSDRLPRRDSGSGSGLVSKTRPLRPLHSM
ncbi:hypothetical protein C8R43DRAFT_530350 [Mycena crocata]|nr:hypothetical protein C8R43DRAFT_530350 [Mycena crocata]